MREIRIPFLFSDNPFCEFVEKIKKKKRLRNQTRQEFLYNTMEALYDESYYASARIGFLTIGRPTSQRQFGAAAQTQTENKQDNIVWLQNVSADLS